MEKGSAPPMEHSEFQQGRMPEAPPTYEQSTGGAGGFQAPPGYPPQEAMYPPLSDMKGAPPPPLETTRVITQVVVLPPIKFGFRPMNMICPHCQHSITTSIDSEPSAMAYVLSAILCVLQLYCCVCIPCCVDSLKRVEHKCPNCNNWLGRYSGSGM